MVAIEHSAVCRQEKREKLLKEKGEEWAGMPRAIEALAPPSAHSGPAASEILQWSPGASASASSSEEQTAHKPPAYTPEARSASATLYLGSSSAAKDSTWLFNAKIGFVLNCADDVKAPSELYDHLGVQWTQLSALKDVTSCDISPYFDSCIKTIGEKLSQGVSVLVHCAAGMSRSASIVIGFLISPEGRQMSLVDAVHHVRERRPLVYPNKGFFLALIRLEGTLWPDRPQSILPEMIELHEDCTLLE
uniref:protein-tyrosine-phosphatase n=1 Tax=Chromera velia CCMP2878 TaxID=1169474 RepID=A0A0G4HIQ0_9ALVE|eukprot:Cvel_28014.t1-p1 / transcript=Cvel_28014.t1 / gene=Cvel_28014 / organism=Chromera_velia_CCMP2878 / gene_product=Dual specificity protein phosphatase 1, putative / transcript_product=Dual specificity protein phosphatase 1, putative / location=Cvel_scaffold3593:3128-3868(-) / protein_length=247 / sequence_SO=supercontig / SO=protein_coding / is_pseudo=false